MSKQLSTFLAKYHKQDLLKHPVAKKQNKEMLLVVNKYFPLVNLKDEIDGLWLPVWYQSMINKDTLQQAYEDIRNKNFDLWQSIPFTQQNQLLQIDIALIKESLPKFVFDNVTITVAFLEPLFNSLIDKQTPIFELPQFFKLYKDFKDQVIHPSTYGSLPFKTGFSPVEFVFEQDNWVSLYHPTFKILYLLNDFKIALRLPLDINKEYSLKQCKKLTIAVLENDVELVKSLLLEYDAYSKKARQKASKKSFAKIKTL